MRVRIQILLMMIGLTVAFSSCEGPMGPEGPAGFDKLEVFEMTVEQGHWVRDKEQGVFYYVFEDRRLNRSVVEDGLVHVELIDGAYFPLPLTEYFYADGYIAETISYSYGVGWIQFTIGSDNMFDNEDDFYQPLKHRFKVTLF